MGSSQQSCDLLHRVVCHVLASVKPTGTVNSLWCDLNLADRLVDASLIQIGFVMLSEPVW